MEIDVIRFLDAKTTPETKRVKAGEGVKKKRKKKQAKVEKANIKSEREKQALEIVQKLIANEVALIEQEKQRFTKLRSEFNLSIRVAGTKDPATLTLYEEVGPAYTRVIEGYDALFIERGKQLIRLEKDSTETRARYAKVKRKLISAEKELATQDEEGLRIIAAWMSVREKEGQELPKREKVNRLSSEERRYLRDKAALYKQLYDEATSQGVASIEVNARIEKYTNRKANLKAQKQLLAAQEEAFKKETGRLKSQFHTFKSRNSYVLRPLVNIVELPSTTTTTIEIEIIEEKEEEPLLMEEEIGGGDESELSETEGSLIVVDRTNDIREKLSAANYDALTTQFSEPYQELYLAPLLRMYKLNRRLAIQEEALDYIALLLDTRGEVIATLYQKLLERTTKEPDSALEPILLYLESVKPPLEIGDIERKLKNLVKREPLLSKLKFLNAINRFIHDEQDEVEEEEEEAVDITVIEEANITNEGEEEGKGYVRLIETEAGDMQIVENGKIFDVAEVLRESVKAQILLASYEVSDTTSIDDYSNRACIYRARHKRKDTPLIIKINVSRGTQDKVEAQIHQLLGSTMGFVKLETFSELAHFPSSLFTPCRNIKDSYKKVFLYVMEDVPLSFSQVIERLTHKDKLCVLLDILDALRVAKLNYGIEYNNLNLANIRFTQAKSDATTRSYPEAGAECDSLYHVSLIDFGFASLNPAMPVEQRKLLANDDFNAFYNLVNLHELEISPQVTETLNKLLDDSRKRSNRPTILFTALMRSLKK